MFDQYAKSDLELMVGNDERVFWKGRPDKLCYILEGIFNPLLPFAIVWAMFDSFAFTASFAMDMGGAMKFGILGFLLLHMFPVWLYLSGILFVCRSYKHTQYIVTDKGIYISDGVFSYNCQMKPYTEISRINVHRGIFDQYLGVGDIVFSTLGDVRYARGTSVPVEFSISDIRDYQRIFELVKKLQTDIFADTMYPNDLRPQGNHGYKTEYKGL